MALGLAQGHSRVSFARVLAPTHPFAEQRDRLAISPQPFPHFLVVRGDRHPPEPLLALQLLDERGILVRSRSSSDPPSSYVLSTARRGGQRGSKRMPGLSAS